MEEKIQANLNEQAKLQRELIFLMAQRRDRLHREFHAKHGEWDWTVRQRYMDSLTGLDYKWPIPDDARGYGFELINYTPRSFGKEPEGFSLYHPERLEPTHLTVFIKSENIDKCKIDAKTLEAFLMIKELCPEDMKDRGFGIDRREVSWGAAYVQKSDNIPRNRGGFDSDGYKAHLLVN